MVYRNVKEMLDTLRGRLTTFTPKVYEPFSDPDFESMKKSDLAEYASDLGIELKAKATKAEIIKAIKEAD